MMESSQTGLVSRLIDSGLDAKEAAIVTALSTREPLKASEIGTVVNISRMDAYNTIKRLQEKGLVQATVDKPMRFTGKPMGEVFELLISQQAQELRRLEDHLRELESGPDATFLEAQPSTTPAEATFTVVKDRNNVHATIQRLCADAEQDIWLLLGKWGILHFVRGGVIDSVNDAAQRGVNVRVLGNVESKTLKFFDELAEGIEIRHTDQLSMQGVIIDDDVAVQAISVDSNPVGRGREDSALVIEAAEFISAQKELVFINWATATDLHAISKRIEEGQIVEPLHVTLGSGSFYQRLKRYLAEPVQDQHPSSVGWTNAILRVGNETIPEVHALPTFEALGIDTSELMRAIGRRIGEEIALEVATDDDAKFWPDLATRWEQLGMGKLTVKGDPPTVVRVDDAGSCGGAPKLGGPFCHLDEGILEGIITARLGVGVTAVERECTSTGKDHCHFDIILQNPE